MSLLERLHPLGDLVPSLGGWTHQRRRTVLLVGLLVLGTVELLDFAGVLGFGLAEGDILGPVVVWTTIVALSAYWDPAVGDSWGALAEELWRHTKTTTLALVVVLILGSLLVTSLYPDAGEHYRMYATWPGMATLAFGQALFGALIYLVVTSAVFFVGSWWELRGCTPEERVLGEDS